MRISLPALTGLALASALTFGGFYACSAPESVATPTIDNSLPQQAAPSNDDFANLEHIVFIDGNPYCIVWESENPRIVCGGFPSYLIELDEDSTYDKTPRDKVQRHVNAALIHLLLIEQEHDDESRFDPPLRQLLKKYRKVIEASEAYKQEKRRRTLPPLLTTTPSPRQTTPSPTRKPLSTAPPLPSMPAGPRFSPPPAVVRNEPKASQPRTTSPSQPRSQPRSPSRR